MVVVRVCNLLSPTDFNKPIEVKATGRNGPATSDGRNLISGTVVPSAGHEPAWKYKSYESAEWDGSKWSAPTSKNLGGPDYDTDRDWHARTTRHGEGWAHDPTYSQRKRAKPSVSERSQPRLTRGWYEC